MKVLFFGDIVGKIGRKAVKEILPQLKKELKPDLVIANVENIAHGSGVTQKTLSSIEDIGIDLFTSGNHIWKKSQQIEQLLEDKDTKLIRPANYLEKLPGSGSKIVKIKKKKVLVINLVGQVFMHEEFDNPFKVLDKILLSYKKQKPDITLVDFHAEATSEKNALGWHADGRVSAVIGTHTHVPTADAKILPQGTGYISDVGMVGAKDSVIGQGTKEVLEGFLKDSKFKFAIDETGICQINSVFLTIDTKTKKTKKIQRVDKEIEIC